MLASPLLLSTTSGCRQKTRVGQSLPRATRRLGASSSSRPNRGGLPPCNSVKRLLRAEHLREQALWQPTSVLHTRWRRASAATFRSGRLQCFPPHVGAPPGRGPDAGFRPVEETCLPPPRHERTRRRAEVACEPNRRAVSGGTTRAWPPSQWRPLTRRAGQARGFSFGTWPTTGLPIDVRGDERLPSSAACGKPSHWMRPGRPGSKRGQPSLAWSMRAAISGSVSRHTKSHGVEASGRAQSVPAPLWREGFLLCENPGPFYSTF